jgi:hypothetical protein
VSWPISDHGLMARYDQSPEAPRRGRKLIAGAATILAVIAMVMVLAWAFQRSLIYFPET